MTDHAKALADAAREFLNAPYSSDNYDHKHAVRRLSEALAAFDAAQADAGWRPIETAPRDGTPGDLWCEPKGISAGPARVTDCWYYDGKWWQYDEQGDEYCRSEVHNATHWRPLPPPPTEK